MPGMLKIGYTKSDPFNRAIQLSRGTGIPLGYEVDPDTGQFSRNPLHDVYSHGADAFRYIGLMIQDKKERKAQKQTFTPGASWMG